MKIIYSFIALIFFSVMANAQQQISLYKKVPNAKASSLKEIHEMGDDGILRVKGITNPVLNVYKPDKPNGTAVVICPGGGYAILAAGHEGADIAKKFNEWGVTAFVLMYRLPDDVSMTKKSVVPLMDAQRAMQYVRKNSGLYKINKIGIMGFSAGGHLAASLSTRYDEKLISNERHTSLRPDFSVLIYPVISFTDSLTHKGSRENLLGKNFTNAQLQQYSNEMNVTKNTPPAFLVHAKDDPAVPVENSVDYAEALKKYNIPVELKLYESGGHGFGMVNKTATDDLWMNDLKQWMQENKFM